MDLASHDTQTNPALAELAAALPAAFFRYLLRTLAAALPDAGNPALVAENWQAACELLASMQPATPAEAAAAVRHVAAHFASMDAYIQAARPGLSDSTRQRLRSNANATSRTAAAMLKSLPKREKPPKPAPEPPGRASPNFPILNYSTFQPRDRFASPVHPGDIEHLTSAQRRAALAWPRDPELEAIAVAEEEAMIAEQKALEAGRAKQPQMHAHARR